MSVQGLLDEAERTAYLIDDEQMTAAMLGSVAWVLAQMSLARPATAVAAVEAARAERLARRISDKDDAGFARHERQMCTLRA